MPDTPYTDGFKAGMAWREAEIIKLLEEARSVFVEDTVSYGTMTGLIALIKGEQNTMTFHQVDVANLPKPTKFVDGITGKTPIWWQGKK